VKRWWLRPAVRTAAALALPLLVPFLITLLIWALPGDPASIICPRSMCGDSTDILAEKWNLDGSAWEFFRAWLSAALQGDFGRSWRFQQGVPVIELLSDAIPSTLILLSLALVPVSIGVVSAASNLLPARLDPVLYLLGLVPAVVLALLAAAVIELTVQAGPFSDTARLSRLLAGAAVLGLADGVFSGAVTGTRSLFSRENQQRYVGVAILRGESRLSNTLPNVAPALAGQLRARTLSLLSGAVVVESVTRIDGLGDLIWGGTLQQDFGVVLACATCFALLSAGLLLLQALVEVMVAIHIRRSPSVSVVA
jgi:peptide/nickel transport system permease protein